MDVPTYPRPLMITDAAINVEPTLEDKADIVQNAIDWRVRWACTEPKVAILAAVETDESKMRATLDAAALCKMAERTRSPAASSTARWPRQRRVAGRRQDKGIPLGGGRPPTSPVVPDIESGNMLAKQLEYLADALPAAWCSAPAFPSSDQPRADTAETLHLIARSRW